MRLSSLAVVILAALGLAVSANAQATTAPPAPTPTPTRFDNTVINSTYIDLVTTYVVRDLFDAPDQRYWRFLVLAANALTAAGVSVVPRSSLRTDTPAATVATATIGLRRFRSSDQIAIPYRSFGRYLVTLVHLGTEQHAATVIDAINNGALLNDLGVEAAHFVPDINSIYGTDGGLAVGSGDAQLGLGWHVLLVVGVTLVYGLFLTARYRQQSLQNAVTKGDALDGRDDAANHESRWDEVDLEEQQQRLLDKSVMNEHAHNARSRNANASLGDAEFAEDRALAAAAIDPSHPLNASVRQLALCRRALGDVEENDVLAQQAGTLTAGEASVRVANRSMSGPPAKSNSLAVSGVGADADDDGDAEEWSLTRVQDILALEPAYNLPPASGPSAAAGGAAGNAATLRRQYGAGNRKRGARVAALEAELEAKRRAEEEEEARRQAEEEAERRRGSDAADELDLDLPPDASEAEIRLHAEERARKDARSQVPLGLAARRLARMMTTLGEDSSLLNPTFNEHTVHRSYQLSFAAAGAQSPLRQRRGLRAAHFVVKEEVVPAEPSPDASPAASPSPERPTEADGAAPQPAKLTPSPPTATDPAALPPAKLPLKRPTSLPGSAAGSRRPSLLPPPTPTKGVKGVSTPATPKGLLAPPTPNASNTSPAQPGIKTPTQDAPRAPRGPITAADFDEL